MAGCPFLTGKRSLIAAPLPREGTLTAHRPPWGDHRPATSVRPWLVGGSTGSPGRLRERGGNGRAPTGMRPGPHGADPAGGLAGITPPREGSGSGDLVHEGRAGVTVRVDPRGHLGRGEHLVLDVQHVVDL